MSSSPASAWAEVSASALRDNFKTLKKFAGRASLIPVVKADGYGLGALWVAKTLRPPSLAVMTPEEGAQLRAGGFRGRIFLLSPCDGTGIKIAGEEKLVASVSTSSQLRDLERGASKRGRGMEAAVEVNSGMNRLGCEPWELPGLLAAMGPKSWISYGGAYTHFPRAAQDDEGTRRSAEIFRAALKLSGQPQGPSHASASAALVRYGAFGFSHARPGIALYGADPLPGRKKFHPVLSLKARILQLRRVPRGSWISYGRSFRTKRSSLMAVLGLGYADGWRRVLANKGRALIRGMEVPLVGAVCMDMVMADLSLVPEAREGDTATLIGRDGKGVILVEDVAKRAGTISYEILTGIGRRVPRVEVP